MSNKADWQIAYNEYIPEQQHLRESLCTLGNGYFASRGAFEFAKASYDFEHNPHYPGSYVAGIFNTLKSEVADKEIENESIVNWPNWLYLTFEDENGKRFSLDDVDILKFSQILDLQCGRLNTNITFRDQRGRETSIESVRIVSMADKHLSLLEWRLEALNWSGEIKIISGIDGNVKNKGVPRYSDLNGDHLNILDKGSSGEEIIYMHSRTNYSGVELSQAIKTTAIIENEDVDLKRDYVENEQLITHQIPVAIKSGQSIRVSKVMAMYSSKDAGVSNLVNEAIRKVNQAPSVAELLESHEIAWQALWNRCDIEVNAKDSVQKLLRLHIFHLLQVASPNTLDQDISLPSRGIHGEAYRGNLMWDELYIFPVINYMKPSIVQNMLKYRFYRMDEARRAAQEHHYKGAMFPWQSGSNGQENAQEIHLNPESGRWIPDDTHLQRHVNMAIAYNIFSYYKITNDQIFLEDYGAEMIFSITEFLASLATYNEDKKRFEVKHVVGPDEYHTSYPNSEKPGLNNNAYTNIMIAWVMNQAVQMHESLPKFVIKNLDKKLDITEKSVSYWKELSEKIYVPFIQGDIIEQFEGYDQLKELDWDAYQKKYGNIQRLDRILENEGDSANHYKVSKQADVLMLFYLFTIDELKNIFTTLGYPFTPKMLKKNIAYYVERTSHGSTLSRLVHSWVTARANRKMSWKLFEEALRSDVDDIQGGTTTEGIHLGAMAGTVDMVQRAYTGAYVDEKGVLWLNPSLPNEINSISLSLRFRGQCLYVHITNDELYLSHEDGWSDHICVGLKDQGEFKTLSVGESITFTY